MAFHARNRRSSRTTRESSRESVFGLAGWLFADLLLALSVVFLVAQDRPQLDAGEQTIEISTNEYENLLKSGALAESLQEICDKDGCAKASGLSPGEQLIIEVPGGAASGMTLSRMERALNQASLSLEVNESPEKTSWAELQKENRRIGFVIFFTTRDAKIRAQAKQNLDEFVKVLVKKRLVDPELQLEPTEDGSYRHDLFPLLPYYDDDIDDERALRIRALLFTYTSPASGATTTTVED